MATPVGDILVYSDSNVLKHIGLLAGLEGAEVLHGCGGAARVRRCCTSAEVLHECGGAARMRRCCTSAEMLQECGGAARMRRCCTSAEVLHYKGSGGVALQHTAATT